MKGSELDAKPATAPSSNQPHSRHTCTPRKVEKLDVILGSALRRVIHSQQEQRERLRVASTLHTLVRTSGHEPIQL
jgi:hypothetical protein